MHGGNSTFNNDSSRQYVAPEVTRLGTVSDLTLGNGQGFTDLDGNSAPIVGS